MVYNIHKYKLNKEKMRLMNSILKYIEEIGLNIKGILLKIKDKVLVRYIIAMDFGGAISKMINLMDKVYLQVIEIIELLKGYGKMDN